MNMMTTIDPTRATVSPFPYGDMAIESAWAEHRRLMRARFAYLATLEGDEPGNTPHHDLVARLEATIINTPATTLRGAEIQLMVALDHSSGWGHALTTDTQHYLPDENFDGLTSILPTLDFDAKCIATALLSLGAMQPDGATWDAAYAEWLVVEREWDRLSDAAMPDGEFSKAPEAEAAWNEMQRRTPEFQAARDAFMAVPAPNVQALAIKQAIALSSLADEHAVIVEADFARIIGKEDRVISPAPVANEVPAMIQTLERKPSFIMQLHAAYEQGEADYETIDRAQTIAQREGEKDDADRYADILKDGSRGMAAIRHAILLQIPETWIEALTLQFHLLGAVDLRLSSDGGTEEEERAIIIASEHLFDFMCCEVTEEGSDLNVDHEAIGKAFQTEANRVFFLRRRRSGMLED